MAADLGYPVIIVDSEWNQDFYGGRAIRAIAERPLGLVLVDTRLPGDEAWWVLRELRTRHIEIPCLVLVHNSKQDRIARSIGAAEVLQVGFSGETLLDAIGKARYGPNDFL